MTVWRLIRKEILYRKLNFALAVLSVIGATAVVIAAVALLGVHDLETQAILKLKGEQTERRLAQLEDDYRKYMKELGFNILILPADQQLTEFWEKGFATHTMPESNVRKLAESGTQSIRHLLPVVQQKVHWSEHKRRVILIGTRGEVPIKHRRPKEPILVPVAEGSAVIGYELANDLDLTPGDTISLLGKKFIVASTRPEKGTPEDVTIWVNLATAQRLLKMEARINAIEALKCFCMDTGPAEIRREIAAILPDTKVILRENKVTVRAKARSRARAERESAIAAEKASRAELRRTRESLASVLVPLVILGCAVWIGLLALSNVRRRRGEIAILRTIGVSSRKILSVFLVKAVMIGLLGALAGCGIGLGVGFVAAIAGEGGFELEWAGEMLSPGLLVTVILAAPLLAAAASWVPAILAGRQDPAVILQEE
jgi:hypothetical protein